MFCKCAKTFILPKSPLLVSNFENQLTLLSNSKLNKRNIHLHLNFSLSKPDLGVDFFQVRLGTVTEKLAMARYLKGKPGALLFNRQKSLCLYRTR